MTIRIKPPLTCEDNMQITIEIDNHNLIELLRQAEQNDYLKFSLKAETSGGWTEWEWPVTLPQITG